MIEDSTARADLEKKVLCMAKRVPDSDAYWQYMMQTLIGYARYAEDPPSYRDEIPQNFIFFQTRALPYNNHPAIQQLFPNFERVSKLPDIDYFKARLVNTLEYPHIVQWVGAFMAEMNATITAPILYDTNKFFVRTEFGANSNPHWNSLYMSEKLSRKIHIIKTQYFETLDSRQSVFLNNIAGNTSEKL